MKASNKKESTTKPGGASLDKQRAIQREQDQRDAAKSEKAQAKTETKSEAKNKPAVQAGPREQPAQLPAQHVQKPGLESELDLAPGYDAPDYRGSGKLEGFATL